MHHISDTASFVSGMAFHQFIDEARGEYWEAHGIYENLPKSPLSVQALKFCEDIILYDFVDDWQLFIQALRKEQKIPVQFEDSLSPQEVNRWYDMLAEYISTRPTASKIAVLLSSIGFENRQIAEVVGTINFILNDEMSVLGIKQYYFDMSEYVGKTFISL